MTDTLAYVGIPPGTSNIGNDGNCSGRGGFAFTRRYGTATDYSYYKIYFPAASVTESGTISYNPYTRTFDSISDPTRSLKLSPYETTLTTPPPISGLVTDSTSPDYDEINVTLSFPAGSASINKDTGTYIISLNKNNFPKLVFDSVSKSEEAEYLNDVIRKATEVKSGGASVVVLQGGSCDSIYGVKATKSTTNATSTLTLAQTLTIRSPSLSSTGYTYAKSELGVEISGKIDPLLPALSVNFTIAADQDVVSQLTQYTFLATDTPPST